MRARLTSGVLIGLVISLMVPALAGADEAADKAEIQRKKEEAKKAAAEKAAAAAAAKKAAAEAAAAEAKAAEAKKAADDAKAAAEKAAADKKTGTGGASNAGTGGAASTGTGGASSASGGAGGAGKGGTGAGGATNKPELKDQPLPVGDIEKLRADRADRRKASVERLRKRWGSVLADEKGAADLKLHSHRVAFLQRIRVVAEAKKDKKTVELVDQLLTAEDDRHSTAMNSRREGALGK